MNDSSLNTLSGSTEDAPIHVVISHMNERVWIKPSRPVNRQILIGILSDILYLLQSNTCKTVHPNDCPLRVMLTVDEDQELIG